MGSIKYKVGYSLTQQQSLQDLAETGVGTRGETPNQLYSFP